MSLLPKYSAVLEAGVDEAGRGPIAGPVFAAAVILPDDLIIEGLDDSKKLSEKKRYELRKIIEKKAMDYAVASVSNTEIDKINILNATFKAMHLAISKLKIKPEYLIIDGNRFKQFSGIPFSCIVKGDGKYASIAAASILAKTYRDDFMLELSKQYPQYGWDSNKGYGTKKHFEAIEKYGLTPYHRKSFLSKYIYRLDF
jgi:ribonuclease HII